MLAAIGGGVALIAVPALGFMATDTYFVAKDRRLPTGVAVAQVLWGAACVAGGVIGHSIQPSADVVSVPIIVGGAMFGSYPILDWAIRGSPVESARVQLTPSGARLVGRF